jgi:signal transduction histidine kinase/GAF domain-containing protein
VTSTGGWPCGSTLRARRLRLIVCVCVSRYYRPWLDAQNLVNAADGSGSKGLTYDGYRPQNGRDRSLTAFAQLAALRLDARRAMVSLIDTHRQFILAEATRTVSLFSPEAERPGDEVWLGNAILNKSDAVCHHTFSSTYTATEDNGDTIEAECMVVPDCRLDPRFADKDYVKGEPGVRFYAGVPIITRAGNRIGVYAVSDEKPRAGITAAELRFMQDVAAAVMEHLELAKDSDDRLKGERMVKGLTQFIELSAAQDPRENHSSRSSTTMDRQTENARQQTVDEEDTPAHSAPPTTVKQAMRKNHCESDIARIFQRAARIIREGTDADGVVFFDTSAAGIQGQLHDFSRQAGSSDDSATHNTTDFDTGDSTKSRRKRRQTVILPEHSSEAAHAQSKACPVAGLALREGIAALVHADFAFTESGMERYIHRYPNGKFFNYNEEGLGINSSDEKSQTSETDQSDRTQVPSTSAPKKSRKRREKFIPTEFLKVLPNVRTLIFLPLWDLSTERWVAGGFIWTTQAGRLMSPEHELPYLQAFGNSITSEVARLSTQKADKAKTTFIASISHELRSPLHGILGSVEFLRDTVSSTYQESLVSSIETCGKTLLDTIDHVLDYAKINKLRSATSRRNKHHKGAHKRPADNSILGVTADFDLAQLVEEVCDTVCAGHTFRKSQNANGGAIYDQAENTITNARVAQAGVCVSLIVSPCASWTVRSQPGALRRIVMNLLGNALKYTESGYIALKLQQSTSSQQGVNVTLAIEDSGRGMSADYQRTKLFSPFSQEDPFSSGTGLGLSIVKQIIESLKGEIVVNSTLNVGTEIKVSAWLPTAQRNSTEQDHLLRASNELSELSACIITEADACGSERGLKMKESMQAVCQGFNMKVSGLANASISDVDLLLTDSASIAQLLKRTDASRVNRPPLCVVCICPDAVEKTTVESQHVQQMDSLGWIVETFTQP